MLLHCIPELRHLTLYLKNIILYLQHFSKLKKKWHYRTIQGALWILYGAIRSHGEQLRITLLEYFKSRKTHPSALLLKLPVPNVRAQRRQNFQNGKEKDAQEESFKKMFWRPVKRNKTMKEKVTVELWKWIPIQYVLSCSLGQWVHRTVQFPEAVRV